MSLAPLRLVSCHWRYRITGAVVAAIVSLAALMLVPCHWRPRGWYHVTVGVEVCTMSLPV